MLVEVRDLHVRFGEVEAVGGVHLTAYAGRATALLGRNGAGKSTTMRVLAGVVPPTSGTVLVAGHDVRRHPMDAKRAVGYCPDVGGLVPRGSYAWRVRARCGDGVTLTPWSAHDTFTLPTPRAMQYPALTIKMKAAV